MAGKFNGYRKTSSMGFYDPFCLVWMGDMNYAVWRHLWGEYKIIDANCSMRYLVPEEKKEGKRYYIRMPFSVFRTMCNLAKVLQMSLGAYVNLANKLVLDSINEGRKSAGEPQIAINRQKLMTSRRWIIDEETNKAYGFHKRAQLNAPVLWDKSVPLEIRARLLMDASQPRDENFAGEDGIWQGKLL